MRPRPSLRFVGSASALGFAVALASAFAGCGDLIIPQNTNDDGGTPSADGAAPDDDAGLVDGGTSSDSAPSPDGAPATLDCTVDEAGVGHPTQLGCTGLYADWPSRTIAPDAIPFDPGLHLWSDGAEKSRYIYLPPGSKIDTTNMNEWVFPVGTKLWKEFRVLGKKVETRLLWKLAAQEWFRTTYEWSEDESSASELIGGRLNVRGVGYEIPATDVCATCHSGRIDMVLGFEAVSLASPGASGLNMAALKAQMLLTNPPINNAVIPGDPVTSAALGFLHSNCGNACHNRGPSAFAGSTGLFMRMDVDATGALSGDPRQLDTWKTAVNVPSTFQPQGVPPGTFFRIRPKDALTSAIPYRDGRRDGVVQMPPLATHQVDFADVKNVIDWINTITP